jgi:hypothetical protein
MMMNFPNNWVFEIGDCDFCAKGDLVALRFLGALAIRDNFGRSAIPDLLVEKYSNLPMLVLGVGPALTVTMPWDDDEEWDFGVGESYKVSTKSHDCLKVLVKDQIENVPCIMLRRY